MESEKKKFADSSNSIIFHTNTDEKEYPIYITSDKEIWLKAKPYRVERTPPQSSWDSERVSKHYDVPIIACFFVKDVSRAFSLRYNEVTESNMPFSHPLFQKAFSAIVEIAKPEDWRPTFVQGYEIGYEVYQGDMEKLLGESKAHAIKIISSDTPLSGIKFKGKAAWAIAFDWKKRILAKYPELEPYIYISGESGKHERAYTRVNIKLPVSNKDFDDIFTRALSNVIQQVSIADELEKQIQELEKQIETKKAELKALEDQLSNLKLKYQLESIKKQLI